MEERPSQIPVEEYARRTGSTISGNDHQQTIMSNHAYEINIRPLNRGYVVAVGCQSLAFVDTEEMIKCISAYLNNPSEVGNKWMNEKQLPINQ